MAMNLLMLGETATEMTARQRELVTAAVEGCEELGGTIEKRLRLYQYPEKTLETG